VRRLVRDGAAELADLEADGTPPSALRRVVALQGAAMAALGLAGGVALAAGLTALAPAVVRAAAGGGAPVPPLQAALPAAQAAGMAVLAVLAAAVLVAALARRSFREAWPGRPPAGDAG
jgi:ABC-type lipoprotein release transport system permease subunit